MLRHHECKINGADPNTLSAIGLWLYHQQLPKSGDFFLGCFRDSDIGRDISKKCAQ
jgi:hypothetical protein